MKSDYHESDLLRLLRGKTVSILTLLICFFTNICTLWIVFKLDLIDWRSSRPISSMYTKDQLLFNRDIMADSLAPKMGLKLSKIVGKQVSILGGQHRDQFGIIMDRDKIVIQAKTFKSDAFGDLSFILPHRVDSIDIINDLENVKLIKSPYSISKSAKIGLQLTSMQGIEISGNMGLTLHAKQLNINSSDSISFTSKEKSLTLESSDGIHVPLLGLEPETQAAVDRETNSIFGGEPDQLMGKICIDRSNGFVSSCSID